MLPSRGTAAGTAVILQNMISGPAEITNAGGLSPYGTMAQGGNVQEWQETSHDLLNDSELETRQVRGGLWNSFPHALSSLSRSSETIGGNNLIGFRVASIIPEPCTLLLGALANIGLMLRRR